MLLADGGGATRHALQQEKAGAPLGFRRGHPYPPLQLVRQASGLQPPEPQENEFPWF